MIQPMNSLKPIHQKESTISINELVNKIVKLNANQNNIDVAISSKDSKKTITITESNERYLFRFGQLFRQLRRTQKQKNDKINTKHWEQLLQMDRLQTLGSEVRYSNDNQRYKSVTIVFHE
jgi:hypothetical protein